MTLIKMCVCCTVAADPNSRCRFGGCVELLDVDIVIEAAKKQTRSSFDVRGWTWRIQIFHWMRLDSMPPYL